MTPIAPPTNNYDIPCFWLKDTALAISVLDEVGAANAFVQYDVYHAQRYESELAATMSKYLSRIGYTGWIGCEYKPATTTEAGLGWRQQLAQ